MDTFNLEPQDIKNLSLKLEGNLPVDRDELLALVNSWGRNAWFYCSSKDNVEIKIDACEENEKYNLSKLDVSKITNFDDVFAQSNFNGDINSWDVSNGTTMNWMFFSTKKFNSPLDNWDTSNVTSMYHTFYNSLSFNQNLNSWNIFNVTSMISMFESTKAFNQHILWDISKVEICYEIFLEAKAFEKRFNNENPLPINTNEMKEWLKENRDKMIALDVEYSKAKELDNFLLNIDINTLNKPF